MCAIVASRIDESPQHQDVQLIEPTALIQMLFGDQRVLSSLRLLEDCSFQIMKEFRVELLMNVFDVDRFVVPAELTGHYLDVEFGGVVEFRTVET